MKVAHVTLYPPKGEKHVSSSGVASYSKNLITHIPLKTGNQTVVCNIADAGGSVYVDNEAEVHRVFKRTPGFIFSVHNELKKINADVVHIQQELALFGGIATAYLLQWLVFFWRRKTIITLHGVVDPDKIDRTFIKENNSNLPVPLVKMAFRIIYTPLMKWAQKVIVHEQYFKDIIVRSYGIDGSKVEVIPHGVEMLTSLDKRRARTELGVSQGMDIVLFMGYATGYKGIDLLVDGFAEYAKRNPKAFLIIGAGKHPKLSNDGVYLAEYRRLQKKAADAIPKNQYTWEGFIKESDITTYYSASDVSIYPYTTALSSSGPMSFAIGYEKPFLVSTAFADIFSLHPELLFEQDKGALADRLEYFFAHRDSYAKASVVMKQARSWQKVGMQTFHVYESVSE